MDYRDLLIRYIAHIGCIEGIDFLSPRSYDPKLFTPEQYSELRNLSIESDKVNVYTQWINGNLRRSRYGYD